MPTLPDSLASIDLVNPLYNLTYYRKRFLLYDSFDTKRSLVFASDRQLEILAKGNRWHIDGTFKASPDLFHQVYLVHAWLMEEMHACGFVLIDKKSLTSKFAKH